MTGNFERSVLDGILEANVRFRDRVDRSRLPTERKPGAFLLVTCMDPRVNTEAMGLPPFEQDGSSNGTVRVIRTIGGMAEARSLIIGIHLAKAREVVVLMHTDCGCCAAWSNIHVIEKSLTDRVGKAALQAFRAEVGEPFTDKLRAYLKAFQDPEVALRSEVQRIREAPYMPQDVLVHGLLYELATGTAKLVVDGRVA